MVKDRRDGVEVDRTLARWTARATGLVPREKRLVYLTTSVAAARALPVAVACRLGDQIRRLSTTLDAAPSPMRFRFAALPVGRHDLRCTLDDDARFAEADERDNEVAAPVGGVATLPEHVLRPGDLTLHLQSVEPLPPPGRVALTCTLRLTRPALASPATLTATVDLPP